MHPKHRLNQHLDHFLAVVLEASTIKLQTPAGALVGNHRVPAVLGALQACEKADDTLQDQPTSMQSSFDLLTMLQALHACVCRVMTWIL